MEKSDLLPTLHQKITEAKTQRELDDLRADAFNAWKYNDIEAFDAEEVLFAIRERRLFISLVELQSKHLKALAECKTTNELTAIAKQIKWDFEQKKLTQQQYQALCDSGRMRREELSKGATE